MSEIEKRLTDHNITLPEAPAALFNYIPYVISGNQVFISGQISMALGQDIKGCVGKDLTLEQGQEAAKLCALNVLAQVREAVKGDWSRVRKCIKLGGFVNCGADFTDQSLVINTASDLMVTILGLDIGKHARFAVAAPSLPAGFAVEIDAIFEIQP